MTAWMLYTVATSAILALAALCLEYALRDRHLALRWIWAAAMIASIILSAVPWIPRSAASGPYAGPSSEIRSGAPDPPSRASHAIAAYEAEAPFWSVDLLSVPSFPALDRTLLGLAMVLAITGLTMFAGSYRRIARRRRSWRSASIDGVPALISRSVGPAVVGYLHPAIVLPEWVTGMDARRRRLVIMHEQEHLDAGDNQLLGVAFFAVMLMPWNAAFWWLLHRLRQGVELDCDRRVLARAADAGGYGELLIEMGQRSSTRGFALAAFAESSSFLERRIRSIVPSRPRRTNLLLGVSGALLLASLLFFWELPTPRPVEALAITPSPSLSAAPIASVSPRVSAEAAREFPARSVAENRGSPAEPVMDSASQVPVAAASPVSATSSVSAPSSVPTTSRVPAKSPAPAPAPVPPELPPSPAPVARRPPVEDLVQRHYPEIFSSGLAIDRAIWFAIDRNGEIRKSWIGPNLYINLGAAVRPLREFELPDGSREKAEAEAEHQRREREVLLANVPDLEIRSMYAGYFTADGGSAVVHFVTEDPGAGNWGRFRVASAFIADAIDSALRQ